MICETLSPWSRKGKRFLFKGGATGLTKGTFKVRRADVTFKAKGKAMDLHALPGAEIRTTLRIGNQCAVGRAPLRQQTSKALIAP